MRWRRPRISTSSGPDSVVVFHDEIELPPAKVRVKTGGGIAGHNGLRSISAHVGNDYRRVRIGVGTSRRQGAASRATCSATFAKSERPWVEALCDIIADNAELLAQRAGRELPEQGSPRAWTPRASLTTRSRRERGHQARRRNPRLQIQDRQDKRDELDGLQMRHRRPAQCRQVDALQRADRDRGGAGGELSVLHHRAECRRGRGAGSAARHAGDGSPKSAQIIPTRLTFVDIAGLVRGASKGEGLGNQFLANIREVDAIAHVVRCFEDDDVTHVERQDRSDRRHRDHRDRADAGRSRQPGAARRHAGEEGQGQRQGRARRRRSISSTARWRCCARASRRAWSSASRRRRSCFACSAC